MDYGSIRNNCLFLICALIISTQITSVIFNYHKFDILENEIEVEHNSKKKEKLSKLEYEEWQVKLLNLAYKYILLTEKHPYLAKHHGIQSDIACNYVLKAKMFDALAEPVKD